MSTNNPMTLPSASTLTDEQLRVLCAEARGWTHINPDSRDGHCGCEPKQRGVKFYTPVALPDPLHDANAALELLNRHGQWEVSRDDGLIAGIAVTIYKANKAVRCREPDFCRAVVLAVLHAEGKIL